MFRTGASVAKIPVCACFCPEVHDGRPDADLHCLLPGQWTSVSFARPVVSSSPDRAEDNFIFKSSRPTYGVIMLVLSSLYVGATFLPLLYSVVLPRQDLEGVVSALEERGTPPPESGTVVQEAIAALGPLRRAVKVGYYSAVTLKVHYTEPRTSEKIRLSQAIYIAWFQKHPEPTLVAIVCYENGEGEKAYRISGVDPVSLIRGYAIPLGLFGVSLFLARRRKTPSAISRIESYPLK